jgi:hypothetical protein
MNAGSSTTNQEAMWRVGIQASDFGIGISPGLLPASISDDAGARLL